ncbi:hypothetical protein ES705_39535 [subsurface metagenome]
MSDKEKKTRQEKQRESETKNRKRQDAINNLFDIAAQDERRRQSGQSAY